jgi:hypothetical protein
VKIPLLLAAGGALGAAALHLPPHRRPAEPALHLRAAFTFVVPASYAVAFPLFGADKEREWSPGWAPAFVHPAPARDTAGMVFTVAHGGTHSVWVNTAFDAETGHVQYVYVVPGALATLIDIHVRSLDSASTSVSVAYERTALVPEVNDHVRALSAHDAASGPEWEGQVRDCLKASRPAP